jgi:hypothetical protein
MTEPRSLLAQRLMKQRVFEKENRMSGLFPSFDFMRIARDRGVGRYDYPIHLICEFRHPVCVRCSWAEAISKVNDFVLGLNKTIERVRNLRRNVVIEKEPHAAKRFSNSTAS